MFGAMPQLLADLVKDAISELDLEVVADKSELRPAGTGPPPIVIVALEGASTSAWSRDLLQMRPETIVLQVAQNGRELVARALYPSHDSLGVLTAQRLMSAIADATPWDERFLA